MLSFLDVLVVRCANNFDTAVFRKDTNTDIYLHWTSFSLASWKISTLKILIARAFLVCSNDYFLQMEFEHLKKVFVEVNGYPKWLIYNTIKTEQNKKFTSEQIEVEIEDTPDVTEGD